MATKMLHKNQKSLLTEALEKPFTPKIVELDYIIPKHNEIMKINVVHRRNNVIEANECFNNYNSNSERKSGSCIIVYLPRDCQFFEGSFASNSSPYIGSR